MDTEIAQWVAKAQIIEVLHRWCRGIDRGDAELAKSAYHRDAIDDHGVFSGRGWDFVDFALPIMKSAGITSHYLSNHVVDVVGQVAYSECYVLFVQASVRGDDGSLSDIMIGGRYLDRLEKRGGDWRIADRKAVFDWNQTLPASGRWEGIPHSLYRPCGIQDRSDPSYSFFSGPAIRHNP